MKTINLLFLLSLAFLLATSHENAMAAPSDVVHATVDVKDVSAPGSPIKFSGSIPCSEWVEGKELRDKAIGSVQAANVSGREVLALVARVRTQCLHSTISATEYRHDFFFKDHGMPSGETLDVGIEINDGVDHFDLESQPYSNSTAEVLFVQFDNGDIWGNKENGKDIFDQRKETIALLDRLSKASTDEAAFIQILAEHRPMNTFAGEVTFQLDRLRKQSGTSAAIERVKERLKTAETRTATGKF